MKISRFDYRLPALAGMCLSTAGCLATTAFLPAALLSAAFLPAAFLTTESVAVPRASREFNCPSERITVIQRGDVSPSLYDVGACGQRARYVCYGPDTYFVAKDNQASLATNCIREPDPKRWEPDPTLVASLPRRPGTTGDSAYERNFRRICSGDDDSQSCLYLDNGLWRWHMAKPSCPPMYSGIKPTSCQ